MSSRGTTLSDRIVATPPSDAEFPFYDPSDPNAKKSATLTGIQGDAPYWDLAAAVAPTVNDDSNASPNAYSVGSRKYWLSKGLIYEALDVTDGAAVWVRSRPSVPLVAGRWYPLIEGTSVAGTIAADPTLIYVRPFFWHEKATVTSLPVWVTTTDAGKGVKTAVYKMNEATVGYGRPIGAPLISATGILDTAVLSGSTVSPSVTLWPGVYLFASKIESTTARFLTVTSLDRQVESMIGRGVATGSSNAVQHLSINGTSYATAWPTFTGSESWTDVFGQGMPHGWIGV